MTKQNKKGKEGIEQTLCLFKPDTLKRGLSGAVMSRIERAGLKLCGIKMVQTDKEQAKQHYTYEDIGKRLGEELWENLVGFLAEGPIIALVFEGVSAVKVLRKICGATEPAEAAPGTIRGDFCHQTLERSRVSGRVVRNVIHASSSPEDAEREIAVWFSPEEIHSYSRVDEPEHFLT